MTANAAITLVQLLDCDEERIKMATNLDGMACLITPFHEAEESPEDVAIYHEMRMSLLGMKTFETCYAELMAAVKTSGIRTVDVGILLRLLIVRRSKPRVIKFLQTKGDPTSKRLVRFLNEHTSQFTNQGKFPIVNFLSSMPSVSLIGCLWSGSSS